MAKKEIKTNAMRILEREKIPYTTASYECGDFIDGMHTADILGQEYAQSFKTLVAVGKSKEHYVFVLPVDKEIDFKKAAKCVGEKSLELIAVKDLTNLTGYVRGGCTSIGMKKQFKTFIQKSALDYDIIFISGGQIGLQIHLNPNDLAKVVKGCFEDFIVE